VVRERRSHADPVINVAWPGCRLAEIRSHLSDWLRHAPDVLLILSGPALPLVSETDVDYVGPLMYAEAVRALSAEWDVPLVDFRDEWEQLAIRPGLAGSWIDESGAHPTSIGYTHLINQLTREIDRYREFRPPEQAVARHVPSQNLE
jgi:hypothetical protein